MADKHNKYKENIPGRYFVDQECIACDACVLTAEIHFGMDEDDGHAFVIKQPATTEEEELCVEAMEGCPVEAIGNDGESNTTSLPTEKTTTSDPIEPVEKSSATTSASV